MSKRTKYHVATSSGGWGVKKQGAERASAIARTKQEAISIGRGLASKNDNGQLIIHKTDGTIQEERTYGRDPHPPKG